MGLIKVWVSPRYGSHQGMGTLVLSFRIPNRGGLYLRYSAVHYYDYHKSLKFLIVSSVTGIPGRKKVK